MRRFTPIEIAIAVALLGTTAAVAVPTFARELETSRFVEATRGLSRIGAAAVAHAEQHQTLPESSPLTPSAPPRGKKEIDPPGTWDTPTWTALDFRPVPEDAPHAYAFSFEVHRDAFVATARGDLDGDGVLSTFEIRGTTRPDEPPRLEPGLYVEAELE